MVVVAVTNKAESAIIITNELLLEFIIIYISTGLYVCHAFLCHAFRFSDFLWRFIARERERERGRKREREKEKKRERENQFFLT